MNSKEQALGWLRDRKDRLKITVIGRRAGISKLLDIVNENAGGTGYVSTLADKHLPALLKEINELRK